MALNTFPHGNLSVATSEVKREDNTSYLPPFNGNGGTFSGVLPSMLADGSLLYSTGLSSTGANGAYWWQWLAYSHDGELTKAISQGLASSTPHSTTAFRAARLASGKLYGAVITNDSVSIAEVGPTPTNDTYPSLDATVTSTFAEHVAADKIVARAIGDTLFFVTWQTNGDAIYKLSGYRWQEGTASIEQLYANVAAPTMLIAAKNLEELVQIDDQGDAWMLATIFEDIDATALIHVGAAGASVESRPKLVLYTISSLRLLDGSWYAGVGPSFRNAEGNRYIDLVRLR